MKAMVDILRSCRNEFGDVVKGIGLELPVMSASSIAAADDGEQFSVIESRTGFSSDVGGNPVSSESKVKFKLPIHELPTTSEKERNVNWIGDPCTLAEPDLQQDWQRRLSTYYYKIGIPAVNSCIWFDHIWCIVPRTFAKAANENLQHQQSIDSSFSMDGSSVMTDDISVVTTSTPELQDSDADLLDAVAASFIDMDIYLTQTSLHDIVGRSKSTFEAMELYLSSPDSFQLERQSERRRTPSPVTSSDQPEITAAVSLEVTPRDLLTPVTPVSPDGELLVAPSSPNRPNSFYGDVNFELNQPEEVFGSEWPILPVISAEIERQYQEEIRRTNITFFKSQIEICRAEEESKGVAAIFYTLLGHQYQLLEEYDEAVEAYASGQDFIAQKKLMVCIAKKFTISAGLSVQRARQRFARYSTMAKAPNRSESQYLSSELSSFLAWGYSCSPIVGLQVYRLVTELMHRKLSNEIKKLCGPDALADLDDTFKLERNIGISSGNATITNMLSLMQQSQRNRREGGGAGFDPAKSAKDFADGILKQVNLRSDVLNEVIEVTSCAADPVELSINILTRLRELLKENNLVCSGVWTASPDGYKTAILTPDFFDEITSKSAYKSIELEACQIQAVSLNGLNTAQRIVFFANIYNLAVIQGLVLCAKKGGAGNNLYERTIFMRSVKYNIGGNIYNLLDVSSVTVHLLLHL
jgi:hypothetical protein